MKKVFAVLALAAFVSAANAQEPKKEACCKKMEARKEGQKMKCSKDCDKPCCKKKEAKKKA